MGMKSSRKSTKRLQSGNETTELLLTLVWSTVETLLKRGDARLFVGDNEVAVIFKYTIKTSDGLFIHEFVQNLETLETNSATSKK